MAASPPPLSETFGPDIGDQGQSFINDFLVNRKAKDQFAIPKSLNPNLPNFGGPVPPPRFFRGEAWTPSPDGGFTFLNPRSLENLAVQADITAEARAKAEWAKRFPLLAAADKYNINSAYTNTKGGKDPQIYDALKRTGLDVDLGSNPYTYAKNTNQPILGKQQRDRTYNQRLFAEHPVHKLGLGPEDIANIAAWNTGGANAFNASVANENLQSTITGQQQDSQLTAAIIGGIGQASAAGIRGYYDNPNPQLSSGYYAPPIPYGGGDPSYG